MTKTLLIAATAAMLIHTSVKAEPSPPPATRVGVTDNLCGQSRNDSSDIFNLCRYWAANRSLPKPSPARIVFIGDSLTESWKDSRPQFFENDRIDRGISGQTSAQMLVRFYADVINLHPAVVHILAGSNDIAGNGGPTSFEAIENNLRSMVELAQAHRIKVIIGTVPPAARFGWRPEIDPVSSIRALNTWIREYARSRKATLVDYYAALDDGHRALSKSDSADGVHPSPAGYAKMEAALSAALKLGHKR
ncbi:MAG: SGNH/GDSL hydrolase family protein [Sphingomicrobium sp.]